MPHIVAKLAKDIGSDAVGRQFEPCLTACAFARRGAHAVWPRMLFRNCCDYQTAANTCFYMQPSFAPMSIYIICYTLMQMIARY